LNRQRIGRQDKVYFESSLFDGKLLNSTAALSTGIGGRAWLVPKVSALDWVVGINSVPFHSIGPYFQLKYSNQNLGVLIGGRYGTKSGNGNNDDEGPTFTVKASEYAIYTGLQFRLPR